MEVLVTMKTEAQKQTDSDSSNIKHPYERICPNYLKLSARERRIVDMQIELIVWYKMTKCGILDGSEPFP